MSILEISDLGCHIASYRGFVTLSVKGEEKTRIPIDQITSIITKAHGITYTQNLLVKLAEYKIPLVITNKSFKPVSILLPIEGNYKMSAITSAQASHSNKKSLNNYLWQLIVKTKIKQQATALVYLGLDAKNLNELIKEVRAGDISNVEAQAARIYWKLLFGERFKRHRYGHTPNDMLNYGYIIFRSALCRYICAAGLHPALGIHHHHRENSFCLVDDLIEPYRPIIDLCVNYLLDNGEHELNKTSKLLLVKQLEQTVRQGNKWVTVEDSMKKLCQSVAKSYIKDSKSLNLIKSNLSKIVFSL